MGPVLVPTTIALLPGASDIVVLEIVTALSSVRLRPSIEYRPVLLGVIVCPLIVKGGKLRDGSRVVVGLDSSEVLESETRKIWVPEVWRARTEAVAPESSI